MNRAITIIEPGMFTTIQDEGRYGYAHLGVPESGAMDTTAMILGNRLMNNPEGSAVLECTLVGVTVRFEVDSHFVLTGSRAVAFLEDEVVVVGETAFAKAKQVLSIKKIHPGIRTYLSVAGGLQTEKILNSRSFYAPLTARSVFKNQKIKLGASQYGTHKFTRLKNKIALSETGTEVHNISIYEGPEFDLLSISQQQELLETTFTISKNWNRMAVQLEEQLYNELQSIRTAPVLPGTMQLTPSGTLIILCNDCQTTGGYPRIVQVSNKGMQILSQMGAGQKFKMLLV